MTIPCTRRFALDPRAERARLKALQLSQQQRQLAWFVRRNAEARLAERAARAAARLAAAEARAP